MSTDWKVGDVIKARTEEVLELILDIRIDSVDPNACIVIKLYDGKLHVEGIFAKKLSAFRSI